MFLEAQRIEQRTLYDLEMLRETGRLPNFLGRLKTHLTRSIERNRLLSLEI